LVYICIEVIAISKTKVGDLFYEEAGSEFYQRSFKQGKYLQNISKIIRKYRKFYILLRRKEVLEIIQSIE